MTLPFHAAQEVLTDFKNRFITDMDALAVIMEFQFRKIIDDGDVTEIRQQRGRSLQNQELYVCLQRKCTDNTFKTVCDIIIAIVGNPKMNRLGEDMKKRLEMGKCYMCTACVRSHFTIEKLESSIVCIIMFVCA